MRDNDELRSLGAVEVELEEDPTLMKVIDEGRAASSTDSETQSSRPGDYSVTASIESTESLTTSSVFRKSKRTKIGIGLKRGRRSTVVISSILDDGLFSRTPLQVGHVILSINGIDCSRMQPKDVARILAEAKGTISIVSRPPPNESKRTDRDRRNRDHEAHSQPGLRRSASRRSGRHKSSSSHASDKTDHASHSQPTLRRSGSRRSGRHKSSSSHASDKTDHGSHSQPTLRRSGSRRSRRHRSSSSVDSSDRTDHESYSQPNLQRSGSRRSGRHKSSSRDVPGDRFDPESQSQIAVQRSGSRRSGRHKTTLQDYVEKTNYESHSQPTLRRSGSRRSVHHETSSHSSPSNDLPEKIKVQRKKSFNTASSEKKANKSKQSQTAAKDQTQPEDRTLASSPSEFSSKPREITVKNKFKKQKNLPKLKTAITDSVVEPKGAEEFKRSTSLPVKQNENKNPVPPKIQVFTKKPRRRIFLPQSKRKAASQPNQVVPIISENSPEVREVTQDVDTFSATIYKHTKDTKTGLCVKRRNNGAIYVSHVDKNSLVSTTPLMIGDEIVSINSVSCKGMDTKKVASLVHNTAGPIKIVARSKRITGRVTDQIVSVTAIKKSQDVPAGLEIMRGADKVLTIFKICEDSLFSSTALEPGDELISINNVNCEGMDLCQVAALCYSAQKSITLLARRKIENRCLNELENILEMSTVSWCATHKTRSGISHARDDTEKRRESVNAREGPDDDNVADDQSHGSSRTEISWKEIIPLPGCEEQAVPDEEMILGACASIVSDDESISDLSREKGLKRALRDTFICWWCRDGETNPLDDANRLCC